jgi:ribonucleoside-diphosphate reductase alpha chain
LSAGLQRRDYARVKERPRVTSGETEKLKTGCGLLYITINRDENNRPIEVFSSLGKGGGCASSSEAAARLVSLCLRCDVNPREIVRQLRGIRCATACSARAAGKPVDVLSCPDGVAQAIERILVDRQESAHKAQLLAVCPSCGGQRQPGRCGVCLSCWEGGCEGA